MPTERSLDYLKEVLFLTISAPVKAGAVHRLLLDPVFEARLSEGVIISRYIEEAYAKGRDLARGSLEAKSLGLGNIFSTALRDTFEFTERRPIIGLAYASLVLALIAGYSSVTGRSILSESSRVVRTVIYANDYTDTISMIEGLEAVGASDYLLHLEGKDVTKRSIRLNLLSIGDISERLMDLDYGFLFNIRGLNLVKEIYSAIADSKNIIEAIVKSYYLLGVYKGIFERGIDNKRIQNYMIKIEKTKKIKGDGDKLLGGVYLSTALRHLEKPYPLP